MSSKPTGLAPEVLKHINETASKEWQTRRGKTAKCRVTEFHHGSGLRLSVECLYVDAAGVTWARGYLTLPTEASALAAVPMLDRAIFEAEYTATHPECETSGFAVIPDADLPERFRIKVSELASDVAEASVDAEVVS